jgi:hypothetical protein
MIIAAVAWQELDAASRNKAIAILTGLPDSDDLTRSMPSSFADANLYIFMRAATWPDMVRSDNHPLHKSEHRSNWHYINYPIELDGARGVPVIDRWSLGSQPTNVVQALGYVQRELTVPTTRPERRAADLCWILHLIGDMHQPLHAAAMYSARFPKGDQGGNLVIVGGKNGGSTALHSLWDKSLGDRAKVATLVKRAEEIRSDPKLSRGSLAAQLKVVDERAWAQESFAVARDVAYANGQLKFITEEENARKQPAPPLPAGYDEQMKEAARQRAALAGYRLADRLKLLLK